MSPFWKCVLLSSCVKSGVVYVKNIDISHQTILPRIGKVKLRSFVGDDYIIILWCDIGNIVGIYHNLYGVQRILMRCIKHLADYVLGWRKLLLMRLWRSFAWPTIFKVSQDYSYNLLSLNMHTTLKRHCITLMYLDLI